MADEANTQPAINITLGITGASGSIFAREMLRALDADLRVSRINLIATDSALRVLAEELNLPGRNELAARLLGHESAKVKLHADGDIGANIASGSYPTHAMIVLPCSMGTLAGIANGMASSLVQRAADVCLKEQRKLVLCVRETPFNRIHLRNMTLAAEAGATIYPVIPTFYNQPSDVEEMARQFCYRVLAHVGLSQPDAFVWQADEA